MFIRILRRILLLDLPLILQIRLIPYKQYHYIRVCELLELSEPVGDVLEGGEGGGVVY